jgi:hypothetical protein
VTYGEYLVTGKRNYRGHEPGTTFEANLAPGPEGRAIARGDIRLLRKIEPTVQPGSYTFPDGWLTDAATTTRQNQGG